MLCRYSFENDCIAAMSDLSNLRYHWGFDNATAPALFPTEIRAEISSQFHRSEILPFIRNVSKLFSNSSLRLF